MAEARLVIQLHGAEPTGDNRGAYHHRVANSHLLFEGQARYRLRTLSLDAPAFPALAQAGALLVIHDLGAPELRPLILRRREAGLVTLFECADQVGAGTAPWLPPAHPRSSSLGWQSILATAALCDGLQVSTPYLAERLRPVNPRSAVFPNYVPVPDHLPPKPARFTFGWAGSRSHRDDLALIAPTLVAFCRRHPEVRCRVMGDPSTFQPLFPDLGPEQFQMVPHGSYEDYLRFLSALHVGIAPLAATPFNLGRTDLKFAEFTACGVASLLADHPVYRPHHPHTASYGDPGQLEEQLETLHREPGRRAGLVRAALDWLGRERSRERLVADRMAFYDGFPGQAGRCLPPETPASLTARMGEAWRRYGQGHPLEALALCRDLLAERPGHARARWLGTLCLEAAGRDEELLAWAGPGLADPLYEDLTAERACLAARRIRPAEASGHLQRIRSPLIRLRLQAAQVPDKPAFYGAILAEDPFDFFALGASIRLLARRDPAHPSLPALRARLRCLEGKGC